MGSAALQIQIGGALKEEDTAIQKKERELAAARQELQMKERQVKARIKRKRKALQTADTSRAPKKVINLPSNGKNGKQKPLQMKPLLVSDSLKQKTLLNQQRERALAAKKAELTIDEELSRKADRKGTAKRTQLVQPKIFRI